MTSAALLEADFATLPDYVGNAVVSSEDRTFWKNSGVSITGTARAFLNNIRGGATQGGSTLTQQYAERYYTSGTTSDYLGKAKEAIHEVWPVELVLRESSGQPP